MNVQLMEYNPNYPFIYQVANQKGKLSNYSDPFKTAYHAKKWYESHGENLEKLFSRKLILTLRKYKYNSTTTPELQNV